MARKSWSPRSGEDPHRVRERVIEACREMPPEYMQIILLRHLRRMSISEISDFLGVSLKTAESRLRRARLRLKDKLGDLYGDVASTI